MIVAGVIIVIFLACFGLITFIGAPYVPTHKRQIVKAFNELYPLTKDDLVVDLGSGDGVMLRVAAARGARALGYELNPILWFISRALSSRYGGRVQVRCRNMWTASIPADTTLVYMFIDSRFTKRVARKLQAHVKRTGKPIRYMSYGFTLPGATLDGEVGGMLLYTIKP